MLQKRVSWMPLDADCRDWRLIEVDSSLAEVEAHRRRLLRLLTPADTVLLWLTPRAFCQPYQSSPEHKRQCKYTAISGNSWLSRQGACKVYHNLPRTLGRCSAGWVMQTMQVMALNIGAALWLAASGEGLLRCRPDGPAGPENASPYRSEVCSFCTTIKRRTACCPNGGACETAGVGVYLLRRLHPSFHHVMLSQGYALDVQ